MTRVNNVGVKDGIKPVYMALYFIGAILSGAGGNYLWMRNSAPEIIAPDRFTGAQGAALSERLANIERIVFAHEDMSTQARLEYATRLSALETQIESLEEDIKEHERGH